MGCWRRHHDLVIAIRQKPTELIGIDPFPRLTSDFEEVCREHHLPEALIHPPGLSFRPEERQP